MTTPQLKLATVAYPTSPYNFSIVTSKSGVAWNFQDGDTDGDFWYSDGQYLQVENVRSKYNGGGRAAPTFFVANSDPAPSLSNFQDPIQLEWIDQDTDVNNANTGANSTQFGNGWANTQHNFAAGQVNCGASIAPPCTRDLNRAFAFGTIYDSGGTWQATALLDDGSSPAPTPIALNANGTFSLMMTYSSRVPTVARLKITRLVAGANGGLIPSFVVLPTIKRARSRATSELLTQGVFGGVRGG